MAAVSAVLPLPLPPAIPTRKGGRAGIARSGRRATETDGEARRSDVLEGGLDRGEAELTEQTAELALGAGDAHEVPEPMRPRHGRTWLVRVELPRVDVEDHGLSLPLVHARDGRAEQGLGDEAEISAPDGQVGPGQPRRPDRNLPQLLAVGRRDGMRKARGRRKTVPVVGDRIHARV